MEKNRPKSAMFTKVNINNNKYFPWKQNNTTMNRTFFTQEKEKGDKYFRSTRVGSCRKIVVRNGIPLALPFRVKNPRGEPLTHFNYTLKQFPKNVTNYFTDYCIKRRENHLGMDRKPLVPYNPNHTRSQLPNDLSFRVIRNYSTFGIGNEGLINRKQWISTYADSYQPIKTYYISNPGITSAMNKRAHYKFKNIEYK